MPLLTELDQFTSHNYKYAAPDGAEEGQQSHKNHKLR
jgi:hypothetical protein